MVWRDVFPPGSDGEGHWTGTDCPCNPWAYYDDNAKIVVAHRHFTEAVIFTGSTCPAGAYMEVE